MSRGHGEGEAPLRELGTFEYGQDRLKVYLRAVSMGDDLIVLIYNRRAHAGAVALAEVDPSSGRAYASLISAPGHREDELARKAALTLSKKLNRRVCVIAGIHVDEITTQEIDAIVENCRELVDLFIRRFQGG